MIFVRTFGLIGKAVEIIMLKNISAKNHTLKLSSWLVTLKCVIVEHHDDSLYTSAMWRNEWSDRVHDIARRTGRLRSVVGW